MVADSKTLEFTKELNYISNEKFKEYLNNIIPLIPEYFFKVSASSTGKYHPAFSNGEGGLLRHTKVAVRIGYELLNNNSINNFTSEEKDMILIAILLHDILKHGNNGSYTKFEHPILASEFVKEHKFNLNEDEINLISDMIKTHMGEWTKDYEGKEVLEKPITKYQRFVHMCDYLASRKFLDVKFLNNDIID